MPSFRQRGSCTGKHYLDPNTGWACETGTWQHYRGGYGYSHYTAPGEPGDPVGPDWAQGQWLWIGEETIQDPTGLTTLADCNCVVFGWCPLQEINGSPVTESWRRDPSNEANSQRGGVTLRWHNDRINCLFFDGHVKAMKQTQITLQNVDPAS